MDAPRKPPVIPENLSSGKSNEFSRPVDHCRIETLFMNMSSSSQISDIVAGLYYLHHLGIIHGDMKSVRNAPFRAHHCFGRDL